MQAVVCNYTGEFVKIGVKDRFDLEDGFLHTFFPLLLAGNTWSTVQATTGFEYSLIQAAISSSPDRI
jgi:hypothetical protein